MVEKYTPSTGEAVDAQVTAARMALTGVGVAMDGAPIPVHEACLSARDDSVFSPSALGLAIRDMIEDGSVTHDPETQEIVFPIAPKMDQ